MRTDDLLTRVVRLERENRSMRRLLAVGLVVAAAIVAMAQAPAAGEVRASSLVLVDGSGQVIGSFGARDGSAVLELRDGSGALIRLGSAGLRGAVQYRDESGELRDLTQPHYGVTRVR
jgi:hypothetical protein